MIHVLRTSGWLAVCLCLSTATWAVAASDGILIYGPEDAGMQEQQQAAALLEASIGEEAVPDASIHILDLPFPSPDPIWIAGDARVVPCTDPAFENEDLTALLDEGIEHIDALDYEEGKRTLDHAITALPCSINAVPREVLIDLYYFRGIAAYHLGDRDGARQSFQYALAIDKEKTWDTNYPPEPQQVFLLAKEDAIGLGRIPIGHDVAGASIGDLSFDGTPIDARVEGVLQAIPGMHLVQYAVDGTPYSRLVEVRKEGPAALVTRAGLTAAVMGGPDAVGMLPAARASLRALVQGRNLRRAFVVVLDGGGSGRVFQYDETYTALPMARIAATTASVSSSSATVDRPSSSPGGLSLGLGGFGYAHRTAYASFGLRGHVKLYRGLEVDAGGGVNVKRYERDGGNWAAVLPFVRLGVRYRFGQSAFRPYVGGALLLNFWGVPPQDDSDEVTVNHVSPGGVLLGGFDVHLSDRIYVNLDANVGYSFALWVGVQGGLGFRF